MPNREPLRVAIDMTFPDRNVAGSNVYATELVRELGLRDDLVVKTVSAGRAGLMASAGWLVREARQAVATANVVHCPAFVAPWRMPVPYVLTVHDTSALDFPEDHALEWRAYVRAFLGRRARAATRIITGTFHSRKEISTDLGVPGDRIDVTPYGVSTRFARPASLRPTVADPPQVLFPGRPTRRKNLDLVLTAMAAALPGSMFAKARLVITGAREDDFAMHRQRIDALGLKPRVDWRGHVPAEEMPDLVATSDLVVYPSLQEGFGFPPLEAMAAGTPVVSSSASCLPEVLGDGALLVDPNDVGSFLSAAEAILTNTALRNDLVVKGHSRAATFTWRRCADLTAKTYRTAAAASRVERAREK